MSDENMKKTFLLRMQKTANALKSNGFAVEICDSGKEAAEKIISIIGKGKKIGFGGSVTANELNLNSILQAGNTTYAHKTEITGHIT